MSITEQLLQLLAGGGLTGIAGRFGHPGAVDKLKILAEIPNGFFQHRLGLPFAALLGRARVVMRAVQADAQVGPAAHAGLAAPRLAGQRPFLAAVVAVPGHQIYDFRFTIAAQSNFNLVNRES